MAKSRAFRWQLSTGTSYFASGYGNRPYSLMSVHAVAVASRRLVKAQENCSILVRSPGLVAGAAGAVVGKGRSVCCNSIAFNVMPKQRVEQLILRITNDFAVGPVSRPGQRPEQRVQRLSKAQALARTQ
jgi:hypothetical protein